MFRRLAPIAFSLLAVAAGPKDDPRRTRSVEWSPPIGIWQFEQVIENGTKLPDGSFGGWQLKILKDGWSFQGSVKTEGNTTITSEEVADWRHVIQPRKSIMDICLCKGLYKLKGGTLTICLGTQRPDDFAAPKGSGRTLWVLRRIGR